MDRRNFFRTLAGTTFAGALLSQTGCSRPSPSTETSADSTAAGTGGGRTLGTIGVQLYTVRDLLSKDFEGTLRQVAGIGYKEFEFAGYYERKPQEIRKLLDELQVTAPSAHIPIEDIRGKLDATIEAAKTMGHQYVIVPYLAEDQRTAEGYKKLIETLNSAGERLQQEGLKLAYHNHDFEFQQVGGQTAFEMIMKETDPERVAIELDLFWAKKAGHDPLQLFQTYPGRVHFVHVKDMTAAGEMAPVGEGQTNFAQIFAQSENAGIKHYIVEHDNPQDAIQSITTSYGNLSKLTY